MLMMMVYLASSSPVSWSTMVVGNLTASPPRQSQQRYPKPGACFSTLVCHLRLLLLNVAQHYMSVN